MEDEHKGTVYTAEFVGDNDEDREPGTYITIRLDGDPRVKAGRVKVIYIEDEK